MRRDSVGISYSESHPKQVGFGSPEGRIAFDWEGEGGESKHRVVEGLWDGKEAMPSPFLENRQVLRGSPAFEEILEQVTMGKECFYC